VQRHRVPESAWFGIALGALLLGFFHESLLGRRILSPADVLLVEASFRPEAGADYEPSNRLLMDPVLQFQPWLEFNRAMLRQGRLPLWNPYAGCGAPHLANGQSAVFDPFNLIAYATTVSAALGWMAFGRLWVAGMGMFLLARAWGAERLGRWFAGLVYPLCGFLIVWLLYPITPVAIWLPWFLLVTDRTLRQPSTRSAGLLAALVALVVAGGHIQTSAHVLMAGGLFAIWRIRSVEAPRRARSLGFWSGAVVLGLVVASVQIVPLWGYLQKSPVWEDRHREMQAWWRLSRPRLREAACTAFPYLYGSQRRGHPNLARALGVNNLNESAGGYAGLATLIWLAPLGLRAGRRNTEPRFLATLAALGALGAFRIPPVDNLLRALPVLDVMDHRRLVLWLAFSLSLLGGLGIDALAKGERLSRAWITVWLAGAVILGTVALLVPRMEGRMRLEVERHAEGKATEASLQRARGERQIRAALTFLPRYYGTAAVELALLGAMALAVRSRPRLGSVFAPVVLGLTLAELVLFGYGLNPAIPSERHNFEPPVVRRLRERLGTQGRALGRGEELPPNVLMRFGLGDPRNYDSIELARSLNWFAPLYQPGDEAQTSRREVTWEGVRRARGRLEAAGVGAVVGATPPPTGWFEEVERAGEVWIVWIDGRPWASAGSSATTLEFRREPGRASIRVVAAAGDEVVIRETWDPGWRARLDGKPVIPAAHADAFISVRIPAGDHVVMLEYQDSNTMISAFLSIFGALALILALTGKLRF
jgi:hypothetical protein